MQFDGEEFGRLPKEHAMMCLTQMTEGRIHVMPAAAEARRQGGPAVQPGFFRQQVRSCSNPWRVTALVASPLGAPLPGRTWSRPARRAGRTLVRSRPPCPGRIRLGKAARARTGLPGAAQRLGLGVQRIRRYGGTGRINKLKRDTLDIQRTHR